MVGSVKKLLLLLIVLLLMACKIVLPTQLPPQPTPALTPVRPAAPLTVDTVPLMAELARFEADGAGPVAALTFTPDGRHLLVVYGKEGVLRRWRVADGALLTTLDVGPVGVTAATFDAEGRLLATGAGKTSLTVRAGYSANFRGAYLWDTQTGQLLFEFDALDIGPLLSDVALSPDGHWLVGTEAGGRTIWDATTGHGVIRGIETYEAGDGQQVAAMPDVVIFDPAGEWIVTAYEHGEIGAEIWDGKWLDAEGGPFLFSEAETPPVIPLALAFDPTRRWLAAIMGEWLQVRDLKRWPFRQPLHVNVGEGPAGALAFSPDGRLLAVGTGGGWQVWSVPDFELLASGTDQAVFAVAFSPDGRLLAWGDADGVVHLWGKAME